MPNYDIEKFKNWLLKQGCEILPATNQYEVIRFKGRESGVIYSSGKTSGKYSSNALLCFLRGDKWAGAPVSTGRQNNYRKEKEKLIDRDGHACFYCGKLLADDITIEHLIPLTAGGKNELSNMVLAHQFCNNYASHKPISEKVSIAISRRMNNLINDMKNE